MLSKCDRLEKISICPFRLEARHLVMTEDHEISFPLSGGSRCLGEGAGSVTKCHHVPSLCGMCSTTVAAVYFFVVVVVETCDCLQKM